MFAVLPESRLIPSHLPLTVKILSMNAYSPSLYRTNAAQTPAPSPETIGSLLQDVEECNKHLKTDPYNPELWTARAACFLALNYPEIAAGDAYKAGLLFDRQSDAPHGKENGTGDKVAGTTEKEVSQSRLRAYGILGQALFDCHCHLEAAEFWEDVAKKVPGPTPKKKAEDLRALLDQKQKAAEAAGLGGGPQEQKDRLKDGGVVTVNYPWIQSTRNLETMSMVNEEFASVDPQSCYLAQSTLDQKDETSMLGVFAFRDLKAGEYFLIDRTATGSCSKPEGFICANCFGRVKCPPVQAPCCTTSVEAAHEAMAKGTPSYSVYCSTACFQLALETYHKVVCGKGFGWLSALATGLEVNASPMRPLLMLRFLASCVQAGPEKSPLEHPLINRLQPLANRDHVDVFTLNESIIAPIKILQQLGVDVFANPNFDTMVLHSIWTRIANNKVGSPDPHRGFIDAINPFLPLFNHSCEPNVEYKREDSSTTMKFFAKRDINKGEELFNSYANVEGMPLEQREELLWPWFEGPCLCMKCQDERGRGMPSGY